MRPKKYPKPRENQKNERKYLKTYTTGQRLISRIYAEKSLTTEDEKGTMNP